MNKKILPVMAGIAALGGLFAARRKKNHNK
ncbi:MAG: LPXTG cell wall anchor domain-containing protein [Alphaproteobacteria bacterium]|nr:LPXTG cell wall anchor domain-containing protein [Alphaproteobacteria bacterium]